MESGIDNRREKLRWSEDPKRYIPGRGTITITKQIAGKDQSSNIKWTKLNFAKIEKELETLIHAERICSQETGMEFSIEKCTMLIMKSWKRHMTHGIELPNQENIRTFGEKETYKYLEILKAETIKQVEMKEKIQKRVSQENKISTLYHRNLIKGIDTWAVPF